jgi:hypothetical protein
MSKNTKQQIQQRYVQAKACLDNGYCLECGCKTPELFYADKACSADKPCYKQLNMSKKKDKKKDKNSLDLKYFLDIEVPKDKVKVKKKDE